MKTNKLVLVRKVKKKYMNRLPFKWKMFKTPWIKTFNCLVTLNINNTNVFKNFAFTIHNNEIS